MGNLSNGQSTDDDLVELKVNVSRNAYHALVVLSERGLFGSTPQDVAERFIDERLQQHIQLPLITIDEMNRVPVARNQQLSATVRNLPTIDATNHLYR